MRSDQVKTNRNENVSRRQALRLLGGVGAGAVLASQKQGVSAATRSLQDAATPAVSSDEPLLAEEGPIKIYDKGAQLPTEDVTVRWLDYGQGIGGYWDAFVPAYQAAHPNITIAYDNVPFTQVQEVIPLGIQSGDPHNVYRSVPTVPVPQAVAEGWVAPLDDIIPNFEQWKAGFPPGSLVNGINQFDGKTYTFPIVSQRLRPVMFYNVDLMQAAGYDPAVTPLTWDTFRDAAKKITEQGNGEVYGFLIGGQDSIRWAQIVQDMGRLAGAPCGADFINWTTGEFHYIAESFLAATELLLAMQADGSIIPGAMSLQYNDAVGRMPTGVAGLVHLSSATIPEFVTHEQQSEFRFDITGTPFPNSGEPTMMTTTPGGAWYLVTALSGDPQKKVAGDMLAHLGTLEGMQAYLATTGAILPTAFPEANNVPGIDPRAAKSTQYFEDYVRIGPDPRVRNPDAQQVALEQKPVTPNFGEVIQGIMTGQLDDPKQALRDLQDRSQAELEQAIAAAQEKGAQVSREDWVFPNWDPSRDYTAEDYEAL